MIRLQEAQALYLTHSKRLYLRIGATGPVGFLTVRTVSIQRVARWRSFELVPIHLQIGGAEVASPLSFA